MRNKRNMRQMVQLLQHFLKSSPRSQAQKRSAILPPEYRPSVAKLPTDQQFVRNFIINLNASYMYNYYGPPTVAEHKMYLHKKSFLNPLSVGLTRRKAVEINDKAVDKKTLLCDLIKNLNKDKQTIMRYSELQEFLLSLSVEQARQYKKFIVYLYKWLLNEKHTFSPSSIQYELCQQTSQIIIRKIYQAHETGDYQILKNTEEELLTIETLEKARQMKRNGKNLQARDIYQTVYFGRLTEEIDRVEALQFICEKSTEQLDTKFLQNMVSKIKQGLGLKSHQKTLMRTITNIKDLQTPLQNLENVILSTSQGLPQLETQQGINQLLLGKERREEGEMGQKSDKQVGQVSDRTKNS